MSDRRAGWLFAVAIVLGLALLSLPMIFGHSSACEQKVGSSKGHYEKFTGTLRSDEGHVLRCDDGVEAWR